MKRLFFPRSLMAFVLGLGLALSACTSASASSVRSDPEADSKAASSVQKISSESTESIDSVSSEPVISAADSIPEMPVKPDLSQNSISEQDLKAAQLKFQEVFEAVPARELYAGQYDGCKRYTLVNDYDGDGTLEAFAFFGVESDWQPAPFWENINIYYIDSDYNVTALAGGNSGYDTYIGGISCPEPYYADDFSNCFFKSGNECVLAWSVTYWEGDYFALILGVHDGKPVLSYPGSCFYVNDAGQFATLDDNYKEVILQLKDGQIIPAA